MTVERLIQILEKYPKEMLVAVSSRETGWDDIEESRICIRKVLLNGGKQPFVGQHEEIEPLGEEPVDGDVQKILTISYLSN